MMCSVVVVVVCQLSRVILIVCLEYAPCAPDVMCASCAPGLAQMAICASVWCLKTGGRSAEWVLRYSGDR